MLRRAGAIAAGLLAVVLVTASAASINVHDVVVDAEGGGTGCGGRVQHNRSLLAHRLRWRRAACVLTGRVWATESDRDSDKIAVGRHHPSPGATSDCGSYVAL
jgi:hypothetical protein